MPAMRSARSAARTAPRATPSRSRWHLLLAVHFERQLEQVAPAAGAATGEDLAVVVLDDPPAVEHDDFVDHPQRRQLVGDDEGGAALDELGDGGLEAFLRDRVDARRGLVEHDEIGLAQPDPG